MNSFPISDLYEKYLLSSGVCTDNRKIFDDCIFWGIKGPNFNGNNFAVQAIADGAKYAIVDEPDNADQSKIFYVQDSIEALQNLANFHRKQFDIPIIAITGSNGKTTTKELVATVLSKSYRCHFTKGNFNNHLGVPLTLLEMPGDTEVAIIEMGANHQGEIAALCKIAEPTHGLITNIGKAHLEGFGGLEGVKKGKGELYDYLAQTKGVVFINKDEKYLSDLSDELKYRRVYYGLRNNDKVNWLRIEQIDASNKFLKIGFWGDRGAQYEITTQLIGEYNLPNISTAVCLGLYFKVPEKEIVNGISNYVPNANRSQLVNFKGAEIILDAYNANPSSVELALYNFAQMQTFGFSEVIFIGKEFEKEAERLACKYFDTIAELKENVSTSFFSGKKILLKGSRSTNLEQLIKG